MPATREQTKLQDVLASILALVAGYSDGYLYLFYKVYASFMSGNTTQTGLHFGEINFLEAAHSFIPVPCFFAGVFVGTLVEYSNLKSSAWQILLLSCSVLILIVMFGQMFLLPDYISIVMLSLAMGMLNTTLGRIGAQPVSLGYISGVINAAAKHLALAFRNAPVENSQGAWDTHWRRVFQLFSVWIAFLLGAILAGIAVPYFGIASLLLPALILPALAFYQQPNQNF